MDNLPKFRVRWPVSGNMVGSSACILAARATQRLHPGTAIYRFEPDGRESVMSYPVPDAPKEPKETK